MIDTIQQKLTLEGVTGALQKLQGLRRWALKLRNTTLHHEVLELEDILKNIADVNKAPTTSLEIKQWSLRDLLRDIGQMYAPYFSKHHIEFKTGSVKGILIDADKMAFFHIFFNLIHYMGGYADVGTHTQSFISVEAKPYNGQFIAIYLEDNGRYPASLHQQSPFEKPYKKRVLDTIAGVGLAVVQEWVLAIKGSIQLVDKLSQGMKCCVLLPGTQNAFLREKETIRNDQFKESYTDSSA